jgi:broad-specificity NMP kinase/ubiquinone/menaquinone biosynthesis C-methylase UbiE
MVDFIFIAGSPGCGKTTISNLLKDKLNNPPMIDFGWIREFHLDREWKNANKEEEQMSFENLTFILKNYKKYGYKNVIVTDLVEDMVRQIPKLFSKENYIIIRLIVKNDNELKKRVLGERDSGFKNFRKAILLNKSMQKRKLLKNEIGIDNTHNDPMKTLTEVLEIIKREEELLRQWKNDEKAAFEGWDFSYIKKRWIDKQPPWSYPKLARKLVRKSEAILEEATGGGELFSTFAPFPKKTIAIEGYKPNVTVARKRLTKLGVKVLYVKESKNLPFKDGEFDLVLNRHGALNCKEIKRVLSPGGILLTQQVGGDNLGDLLKAFDAKPKWLFNNLKFRTKQLKDLGFKIKLAKEWSGKTTFRDVGAVVYFLKAIPWIVDDFSIKTHFQYLMKLQKKLDKNKKLVFTYKRFLIQAEMGTK